MPRENINIISYGCQDLEECLVHLTWVTTWQVSPPTFADKEDISREQKLLVNKETDLVRAVPGCVQNLHRYVTNLNLVTVFQFTVNMKCGTTVPCDLGPRSFPPQSHCH